MCPECKKDEEDKQQSVQRKSATVGNSGGPAPSSVHEVLRLPGQLLDTETRSFFESRFYHDFSGVRVHTDSRAAQSARDVNAHAYTVGSDIAFAPGRFAPATGEGRRLLAHELAHTVQQSSAAPMAGESIQTKPAVGSADDPREHEADRVADRAVTRAKDPGSSLAPPVTKFNPTEGSIRCRTSPTLQKQAADASQAAPANQQPTPRSLDQTLDPGALSNDAIAEEITSIVNYLRAAAVSSEKNEALVAALLRLGRALASRTAASSPIKVNPEAPEVDPGSVSAQAVLDSSDRANRLGPILAQALPKPSFPQPQPSPRPPLRLVPKPPVVEPPVEPPVVEPPVLEPPVLEPPVLEPPPPGPWLIPLIIIIILLWPNEVARDEDYLPKNPKTPPVPPPVPTPEPPEAAKKGPAPQAPPTPQVPNIPAKKPYPKEKICTDEEYDALQKAYDDACKKSGGMSCSESKLGRKQYAEMDCTEAMRRLEMQRRCLEARKNFQVKCFKEVDPRHIKTLSEHEQGVSNCEKAVLEKCRDNEKSKDLIS